MTAMSEVMEKQILKKIGAIGEEVSSLKKDMNRVLQYIEDSRLTNEEKKLLDNALKAHKEGKLLNMDEVFE